MNLSCAVAGPECLGIGGGRAADGVRNPPRWNRFFIVSDLLDHWHLGGLHVPVRSVRYTGSPHINTASAQSTSIHGLLKVRCFSRIWHGHITRTIC